MSKCVCRHAKQVHKRFNGANVSDAGCATCPCVKYVEAKPAKKPAQCLSCGEPMPDGEEVFNYHGYSGPCPKPPKAEPTFPELAKQHRLMFHETQEQYAKRFGFVSATACSLWESGQRRVPERVIKALIGTLPSWEICEHCQGRGVIEAKPLKRKKKG